MRLQNIEYILEIDLAHFHFEGFKLVYEYLKAFLKFMHLNGMHKTNETFYILCVWHLALCREKEAFIRSAEV